MTPYYDRDGLAILHGDALAVLRTMPRASVHCCVTSPPYWNLRNYNIEGQIGQERSPNTYIACLVEIFQEVRRVLRDDGTLWLNLGDSYVTAGAKGSGGLFGTIAHGKGQATNAGSRFFGISPDFIGTGLKPKDLAGIPWRVALALQADGWYLRSDIVWAKPDPIPESVVDRPTKSHEYLFLLAKQERYYYDSTAIAEPAIHAGQQVALGEKSLSLGQAIEAGIAPSGNALARSVSVAATRNKRSVWTIPTTSYPEAHFATFPLDLVKPCILAGTSAKGYCSICGAPACRETETARTLESGSGRAGRLPQGKRDGPLQGGKTARDLRMGPTLYTCTTGWTPSCSCKERSWLPGIVLDPFGGSGTTLLVAKMLGRHGIMIELNKDYCAMAQRRITYEVMSPKAVAKKATQRSIYSQ